MEQPGPLASLRAHFRFPLRGDQVANRFLVGSGLLLAGLVIPFLPVLFVAGYGVQVMRRATSGEAPRMYPWQDWGALLSDGFRSWVISLVFFVPGAAVMLGGYLFYFVSFLAMTGASGTDPEAGTVILFLLGMVSLFVGIGLGGLLFVVASIFFPAALAHFAAEGRLVAAFHMRAWWRVMRSNPWGFAVAWLIVVGLFSLTYIASMTAYFTIVLICFLPILLLPIYFYLMLVGASLFGSAYAEGKAAQPTAG